MKTRASVNQVADEMEAPSVAYRASVLYCVDDPRRAGIGASIRAIEDGLVVVSNGRIAAVGEAATELRSLPPNCRIRTFADCILMPGFVDTHVHYVQTGMVGSYGEQLLDWLERFAFPAEERFAEPAHARAMADFFLSELLRNGTTTAVVFGSVHKASADCFFEAASARSLRMVAGKVLMDRHAPEALRDTAASGYDDTKALCERWHGQGRLSVAITPRFAPTSSPEQLRSAGELLGQYPGVYLQTHLSENRSEVAWVKTLFPKCRDYLAVYEEAGLLGPRSIFAHGIHLSAGELERIAAAGATLAFCPTSNLFLGSGLFDFAAAQDAGCSVAFGTDVGAGTSFSMFHTMRAAYETQQLRGRALHPYSAFYSATLGAARALGLDADIGTFAAGHEADFIVVDCHATPLLELRMKQTSSMLEKLFALIALGDDRAVKATYSAGVCVHQR